jgi:fanconi-associated nuclease 1
MDIAEDSFYFARQDLIEKRLREIEAGKSGNIIEAIDLQHRDKGTLCTGVRWDLFTREDLLDVVDVSYSKLDLR